MDRVQSDLHRAGYTSHPPWISSPYPVYLNWRKFVRSLICLLHSEWLIFLPALAALAKGLRPLLRMTMRAGDSLTVDAELNHGFTEVLSPEFVFLTVQAEPA